MQDCNAGRADAGQSGAAGGMLAYGVRARWPIRRRARQRSAIEIVDAEGRLRARSTLQQDAADGAAGG